MTVKQSPPGSAHRLKSMLIRLPRDIVGLLSWDKSFRTNRIIGSYLLNRLGLHLLRVVVSHLLFATRSMLLTALLAPAQRRFFRTHGYLVIENFLPALRFAALTDEIRQYRGEIREETEGSTLTQRVYLTREVLAGLPECQRFVRHEALLKPLRYASSKNRIPFFYLENIMHGGRPAAGRDPQKDLHTDTFHPCVKAWLYLEEVTVSNGPFTLIPGSHRLTWRRLRWEYRQSLLASQARLNPRAERYWDGSFRVNEDDIKALGYGLPQPITVPPNSLLIANVHAVHRRGDAPPGASRLTIWMQSRDNPFNPLFSPFPTLTALAFEFFWKRYTAQRTVEQVRQGHWTIRQGGFSLIRTPQGDAPHHAAVPPLPSH